MKGRLYGIGVGPGDPELMTIKAKKTIEASDVVIVPGEKVEDSIAYKIAKGACENLDEMNIVALDMPMIKDKARLDEMHDRAAKEIEKYLDEGKTALSALHGVCWLCVGVVCKDFSGGLGARYWDG